MKLLTLTIRHTTRPLRDQLDHIKACFRKLRTRAIWKKHVRYGFAVIEIGYNTRTHTWHPHLHAVIHAEYMAQHTLAGIWEHITHGSRVVDIRALSSRERGVAYVTKYLTKGPDDAAMGNDDRLVEWWDAVRGGRLFIRFGDQMEPFPKQVEDGFPNDWQYVSPLHSILKRAQHGEAEAQETLRLLTFPELCESNPMDVYLDDAPD